MLRICYPLLANAVQRLLTVVIFARVFGGRPYCRKFVWAAGSPQAHRRTRLSHAEAFQSISEPPKNNRWLRLLLSIRLQTLSTREPSARHAVAAGMRN